MSSGALKGSHVPVSADAIRAGQQTASRTNKKMASGIIPLTFPPTRAILWDHRPTGPPTWVHFAHYRSPLVVLEEKSLRLAIHFAEQQSCSSYRHLFIGSVTCDTDGEGVTVTIDRFAPLKEGRVVQEDVLPGQLLIECILEKNSAKPSGSVDDLADSLKMVHRHCTGRAKVDTSDLVTLRAYCGYHSNQQHMLFHIDFEMVAPAVKLKATPVPAVSIVPTALSKNLAGPLSLTDLQAAPKAGYLTMDHTRKLLLVLPSDPKVHTLPLIGIWVSGVSNVHDAFVWTRCVRYLCNHSLTDRVCLPPEPFLIVLYSTLHSQPEFYDCLTSNGKRDLQFEMRTCHEVIQISKLSAPRADNPVELELVAVESGPKRDMFDAALQTCHNVLITPVKSDLRLSSHLSGSLEDMVPRSTPAPLLTRAPTVHSSVPEVSLLFDENRYTNFNLKEGYLTNIASKTTSKVAGAPATRVPLKQVNRVSNCAPAPPGGKKSVSPLDLPAGSAAPPGVYPMQQYPYVGGFPLNPYGCMPMYGQPMAPFPMPPMPYAWNMYNGYPPQQRYPPANAGPRTGRGIMGQGSKMHKPVATSSRRLDPSTTSRQPHDADEVPTQRMQPPQHLVKQYHPQQAAALNRPQMTATLNQPHANVASYQPQITTALGQQHVSVGSHQPQSTTMSYEPRATGTSYQPQTTATSYQPQATATSYQPQTTATSYQPQTTATSYQPQATADSYQPQATAASYQPQATAASYQPQTTATSYQPQTTAASYQPQATAASYQPQATAASYQPQATAASYQPQATADSYQPQATAASYQPQPTATSYQPQPTATTKQNLINGQQQQQGPYQTQQQTASMSHQSPIISRQSPVATVRRADTSSPSASPLSQSTGRDSGVHSSDSVDHDSLGTSYDTDQAPANVYDILRMQDSQLRLLQEQLQQLLAKQGSPPSPPGGMAGYETSQPSCSVAVNRSALRGDQHQGSDAPVKTLRMNGKTMDTSLSRGSDTLQSRFELPENCDESTRHDQTIASNDTLNLDELRLTQIQDEAESVLSDMIVDMPDYASLSPEKIRSVSCSLCDCSGNERCPHLHEGGSTLQQDHYHGNDSGTDDERNDDSQPDVSLLLRNQKQFYENLITDVNRFLGQHASVELTDDTVTTEASGSGPDKSQVDDVKQAKSRSKAHDEMDEKRSFDNVVAHTKKQLMKMGVNVDRLNAAEKSYRRDQSSCYLDQLMLPHVSYMSMMLDSDSDLSVDADALAMKYLSDEQLTELARLRQTGPKRSRRRGDGLDQVFRDVSSCAANHMSFASRKYMERYGLLEGTSMADDTVAATTPEVLNVGEFLRKLAADKSYLSSVCSHRDDTTPANLTRASYNSDPSPMLAGNLEWSHFSAGDSPCNFRRADAGLYGSTPADNRGSKPSASSDVTPNRTPEKCRPRRHNLRGGPVELLHNPPAASQKPRRVFDGNARQRGTRETAADKHFGPYLCGTEDMARPRRTVERVLDIERLKELPKLM